MERSKLARSTPYLPEGYGASASGQFVPEDEVMSHLMNLCTQLGMGYIEPDMASWGLPLLATNVKVFANQLDSKYPEEMDNAFVVLRNACCDVRFPVNCRFRFLELVELRARRWNQDGGTNRFYSTMASHFQQQDGKEAMSENTPQQHHQQQQQPSYPSRYSLSHSLSAPHLAPMMLAAAAAAGYQHQHQHQHQRQHQRHPAAAATHQSSLAAIHAGIPLMTNAFNANAAVAAQLTPTGVPVSTSASAASLVGLGSSSMLAHGEVIRGSGKYPSGPFRVPGKNYFRDEVLIRNSDSGKVMGIKGRRVHMIEQLSETVISFQRVAPGTKDRLVQITGPSEESVCRAKQLIEETICRNSSPMQSDNEDVDNGGADRNSVCSTTDDEDEDNDSFRRRNLSRPSYDVDVADDDYAEASFTVTVSAGPKQSLRMTGTNLKILNASKLILEEIFSVGKGRNDDVDMAEVDKIVESVGKLKDFLLNIRKPCKKMSTRVYSREFLLERAKHQLSMVTPDCLPWLAENVPVIVRQDFVWCPRDEERQAPSGRDDQSSTESESEEEQPIPAPIAKQISSKDIHVKASNHGNNDKTKKVEHHEQEAVSVRKKEAITVPPSTVAGSSLAARPKTMVARTVAAATRTTSGGVNVARSPARPRSIAMGASASAKSPTSSTAEALAAKVDAILQRRPTSSSSAAGRPECRPYAARRSVTFRAPATKTPTTTDN